VELCREVHVTSGDTNNNGHAVTKFYLTRLSPSGNNLVLDQVNSFKKLESSKIVKKKCIH
jgi:hypothetical protein